MIGHVLIGGNEVITNSYSVNHTGIDIIGKSENVISYDDGVVEISVNKYRSTNHSAKGLASYGNYIIIRHKNVKTLYAHLKYNSIKVKKKQKVKKGKTIGKMGSTGNSYGIHLHFEVYKNNKRVNPKYYLFKKKYLCIKNYYGKSLIIALKKIKINNSYSYRKKLAFVNNINNYNDYSSQNIKLLNLMKSCKLIKP